MFFQLVLDFFIIISLLWIANVDKWSFLASSLSAVTEEQGERIFIYEETRRY